jgi:hypothetical protein
MTPTPPSRSSTHVFVAVNESAFGEVVFGRRIEAELRARGDRVVFLAPPSHAKLLRGIEHAPLASGDPRVDRQLLELVRRRRPESVILFDAASVLITLEQRRISPRFLQKLDCPVIAHDCWNLPRTGLRIDMGPGFWPIPRAALAFDRRLLPVPACAPEKGAGAYDALPQPPSISRRRARSELGLSPRERLVLMASAWFQEPSLHAFEPIASWARALPELLAAYLALLPQSIRIVHVGPRAWPALERRLGKRYRRRTQCSPEELARLVRAADALLSFNLTSSTVASAIAARLPVIMGTCSTASHGALHPFHIWPGGFHAFLEPLLKRNPYRQAIESVEVLDEAAFVEALKRVLFDATAADHLRERQARYEERVRRLPAAADVVREWLGT